MRILPVLFMIACSTSARAPQSARTGPPIPCELRDYTITSVDAYIERDGNAKIGVNRLRGAELFVEARPSLTAEWLHLQLARHIEAARHATPTADCPLDVDDPTIAVQSSGPGFVVRIRADNEDDANEILQRSKALVSVHAAR